MWEAGQCSSLPLSLPSGALGVETVCRVRASYKDLTAPGRQQRKNESPGGGTRKDMAQLRQRSKQLGVDWEVLWGPGGPSFSLLSPPSAVSSAHLGSLPSLSSGPGKASS